MKKYFVLFFVLVSFQIFGQNISGEWRGFLVQKSGGVSKDYCFVMIIKQHNQRVSGTTKISLWDEPNIFGKMKFSGNFSSNKLIFDETRVIDEEKGTYAFEWCIKTGKLIYSVVGDSAILSGKWNAILPTTCSPGSITVKKYIEPVIVQNNDVEPVEIIEERQIKDGIIVRVPRKKIIIIVSESAKEDGDTISLIFNDTVVLSEYLLTLEEYEFTINYDPTNDDNKLVLYAHNVGQIPPNTAKIQIKSGFFKQEIILKSNLNESDIIHFELK